MPVKSFAFILLLFIGHCNGQVCPAQGSGVNVGLCGASAASIQIIPSNPVVQLNSTLQLSANYLLTDGSPGGSVGAACDGNWSSDTPAVATVSNRGLVSGVSAGTANISCTYAGSSCGGSTCSGTTQVSAQSPPVFNYPNPQTCIQPCPLKQGFGPPSAQAYSDCFQSSGSSHTPYVYSISVGALPGWASLNSSTGCITGTPSAVATTTFTGKVCDSISSCNTIQVSLTVVANANSFYPLSTTGTQTQNKVAGQNSNVPTSLQGTAAATTVQVTSNIVTLTVANNFTAGSGAGACTFAGTCGDTVSLSGFVNVPWLNGLLLGANSSTTSTSLVGPVFNTKGVQVTHADVASTADIGAYAQGPGWNSFVTAPAPFAGSTNCTNGNPCSGQSGVLTSADINSFGTDYSIVGATGLNKNIWTMWTNPASTNNTVYHPSKTSETYDYTISWPDSLNGYFVTFVANSMNVGHAHWSATGCGGQPCTLLDTPVSTGWYTSNSGGLAFPQTPTVPPNNQSPPAYYVDITNNFDPKLIKETYQYSATGCSGQPCVTLLTHTILADIPTICPAWGFTTIGQALGFAKVQMVSSTDGVNDTDFNFALGSGPQNGLGKNMEFHIYNMNTTPLCENWDTTGKSGTTMYNDGITAGLFVLTQGSGYKVNDVISFNSGNNCVGTVPITGVLNNGGVKVTNGLGLPTMTTNSGCVLGTVLIVSGGSGTGLALQESGVGTIASPCCTTIWPSGSTSPTVSTIFTFGIHGGTYSKGAPGFIANSGYGSTTQKLCSGCDTLYWKANTTTIIQQGSNLINGHPANGVTHRGTSTNPPFTISLWSDPACNPSTNCFSIATLPTNPGGSINHSSWPSLSGFSDIGPVIITSAQNVPGTPQQTNPEQASSAFAFSLWAADLTSTPRWFAHNYENTNNHATEDGNCTYVEFICSPDGKFCMVPVDMKKGFPGNVGLGTDSAGKAFCSVFALTLN